MNRRQSPDVWRTMTSVKYETLYTDPISLLRVIHHLTNQRRMNMYSFKRPKQGVTLYCQLLASHYISLYFEGIGY